MVAVASPLVPAHPASVLPHIASSRDPRAIAELVTAVLRSPEVDARHTLDSFACTLRDDGSFSACHQRAFDFVLFQVRYAAGPATFLRPSQRRQGVASCHVAIPPPCEKFGGASTLMALSESRDVMCLAVTLTVQLQRFENDPIAAAAWLRDVKAQYVSSALHLEVLDFMLFQVECGTEGPPLQPLCESDAEVPQETPDEPAPAPAAPVAPPQLPDPARDLAKRRMESVWGRLQLDEKHAALHLLESQEILQPAAPAVEHENWWLRAQQRFWQNAQGDVPKSPRQIAIDRLLIQKQIRQARVQDCMRRQKVCWEGFTKACNALYCDERRGALHMLQLLVDSISYRDEALDRLSKLDAMLTETVNRFRAQDYALQPDAPAAPVHVPDVVPTPEHYFEAFCEQFKRYQQRDWRF